MSASRIGLLVVSLIAAAFFAVPCYQFRDGHWNPGLWIVGVFASFVVAVAAAFYRPGEDRAE